MKHIIILGDGMADWPVKSLNNKTLLQHANIPYMDMLASMGRNGLLATVPEGFHPGSEVANLSVLGYDLSKVYEGRGVLEAASMGVDVLPGEIAMRCNLICVEDGRIKNHSAGHITSEEAAELISYLQKELGTEAVTFHPGVSYRHLLVVKGGKKELTCTPPHDVPGKEFAPLLIKPIVPEAEETARLLNELILRSQELLKNHPINLKRMAEGKDPANSIWPWSPGYRPQMEPLSSTYPQIKSGTVISAVDLIQGIGRYAGLRKVEVEGATGLYDTNYKNKVAAALEALKSEDFVYLHIEASDEAGHEGDVSLKIKTIEDLDSQVVGPVYEAVKGWGEPVAIAILPDHPTPCELRTHTSEPVPFLIWYPGIEADGVEAYNEEAAKQGVYGLLKGDEFMNEFMDN
ncbi:cofactor-independent phosphoglycerate mutase [Bacteroides sp. 224]|uniref:cofactor-independent phosphoglycerate mutase n=1 Tax=Bacteroides sp. 224 TaxID=2302936 RepID=UPI0013D4E386|nr:cofactor-independent phosphoglycerate mutase [Bacteroides sp. 224]NDV64082.1 cofactor-independent phosphoglycerate mutase [Bacteroides sp. 224]